MNSLLCPSASQVERNIGNLSITTIKSAREVTASKVRMSEVTAEK